MDHRFPFDLDVSGELCIPGFGIQESNCGRGRVPIPLDLVGRPPDDWYLRFRDLVLNAADQGRWLPVYRLSDGEFVCMVGRRFQPQPWKRALSMRARHAYNCTKRLSPFYSSGRKGYCESYFFWELPRVRSTLATSLAAIAGSGALCFNYSQTPLALPYMRAVSSWIARQNIRLTPANYFHFYHVYGLLNGPDVSRLLAGRRVVVMTSNIGNRKDRLLRSILDRGASEATFYETSLNRPAFDRIDLARLPDRVDVTLLGAGVGAAHIIAQLEPIRCIAIDAGFALDCWAEPALAATRPYCVPDSDWERVHGAIKPLWCR